MEYIEYLILKYSYMGITIILAGGIIGLPIPDEILLTFIGYYIYQDKLIFTLSFLFSFLGSAIGISISYLLGAKLGLPFLLKYGPKFYISNKKVVLTQYLFQRFGPLLLIFGFFIPGIRHVTGYLAGISQFRFIKFSLYAYLGSIIWVYTFIKLGYELGDKWYKVEYYFIKYSYIPIILIILIFIYFSFRFKKAEK